MDRFPIHAVATISWKGFSIDVYSSEYNHVYDAETHYFDYDEMHSLMYKAFEHDYVPEVIYARFFGRQTKVMRCSEILQVRGDDLVRASILHSDIESMIGDVYAGQTKK